MTKSQQRHEIISNKGRSLGRGKKFPIQLTEQVQVSDSVTLKKGKNYLNFREFRKKAKEKWGMSKEKAKAEWQIMLADVTIPKSKDQQGWLTMPAIHQFKRAPQLPSWP
ncbi:unnamed protein product [Durusdinium trenchii]|uniref:Uncharacterized protein n=1 Tax=Durusdinium trenchii TaxID=1381693 RepID=A0ABP0PAR6_9DINO